MKTNRLITLGLILVMILGFVEPQRALSQSTNLFYQSPGTKRMAERLARISRESNPLNHPFLNRERAQVFHSLLEKAATEPGQGRSLAKRFDLQAQYSLELLNSGHTG